MNKIVIDLDKVVMQIAKRLPNKGTEQGRIPFLTDDLQESIQTDLRGFGEASVGSNLYYARTVHEGRPALTISPKKAKHLKFTVGGRTIFAKKVKQKARKGIPFLREAAEEMNREGYDFLDRYSNEKASGKIADAFNGQIKMDLKL